jgi:transcriptional regulator with GAF, ATPase, and Fis domain
MGREDKIDIELFKVVSRAISKSDDLYEMVHHLTRLLVSALEIRASTIFALNRRTSELEILATFGLSHDYIHKGPLMLDQSISGTLIGEPVLIEDVSSSDRLQYPQEAVKEGIKSIVALPLVVKDDNIGALRLYHNQTWRVSERDLDSLLLLAEIVGLALSYTRTLNTLNTIRETIAEAT